MRPKQSLSGYIRQHLVDLEAQIEAGIRQESIVEDLAKVGFTTTVANFRTLLYRARIRAASKPPVQPQEQLNRPHNKPTTEPPSPLKKPAGFVYSGTKYTDPNDLF